MSHALRERTALVSGVRPDQERLDPGIRLEHARECRSELLDALAPLDSAEEDEEPLGQRKRGLAACSRFDLRDRDRVRDPLEPRLVEAPVAPDALQDRLRGRVHGGAAARLVALEPVDQIGARVARRLVQLLEDVRRRRQARHHRQAPEAGEPPRLGLPLGSLDDIGANAAHGRGNRPQGEEVLRGPVRQPTVVDALDANAVALFDARRPARHDADLVPAPGERRRNRRRVRPDPADPVRGRVLGGDHRDPHQRAIRS